MQLPGIGSSSPPARVHLLAHIDASEAVSEPYWAGRADEFQQVVGDSHGQMDGEVRLFRSGTAPAVKTAKGLANLSAHLALPVTGALTLGIPGLIGGLALDAGLFLLGVTRQGLGNVVSAHDQRKYLPEGDWKGSQTVPLDGRKHTGEGPGSPDLKPTSPELGQFLADGMKAGDTNVVYLAGHGMGIHQTAGMKTKDVAAALDQAKARSGAAPDVLFLDSCLSSTLENLNLLHGKAHLAVASEEVVKLNSDRMPLAQMMAEAGKGGTAEEIASRMVADAGRNAGIPTLSAIDLDKFAQVNERLQPLGIELLKALRDGKQGVLQEAVKASQTYPNSALMPLERSAAKLADLGGFLDNLQSADLSPELKAAAQQTRQALDASILAKATGHGYEKASGVAFQTGTGLLDNQPDKMGTYTDADLAAPWSMFIQLLHQPKAPELLHAITQQAQAAQAAQLAGQAGPESQTKPS